MDRKAITENVRMMEASLSNVLDPSFSCNLTYICHHTLK